MGYLGNEGEGNMDVWKVVDCKSEEEKQTHRPYG